MTATQRTYRWPCRAADEQLRALDGELRRNHAGVSCSLVTEFGPYQQATGVSLDALLETRVALRWSALYFNCTAPDMQVVLQDKAYEEVKITWTDARSEDSAAKALHVVKSWRSISQFPAHVHAFLLLAILLFGSYHYVVAKITATHVSDSKPSAPTLTARTETRASTAPVAKLASPTASTAPSIPFGERLKSLTLATIKGAIGAFAIYAAVFVLIRAVTASVQWLRPTWNNMFPAFFFDVSGCKHHYLHGPVVAIVATIANGILANLVSEQAAQWIAKWI